MRSKWVLLIALALIFIGVGVIQTATQKKQDPSKKQLAELEDKEKLGGLNLNERVQLAKLRGQRQIIVPAVNSLYPVFRTEDELDKSLSRYTAVTAQPVKEFSYLDSSGHIKSWYRFKIIDILSQSPPLPSFVSRTIPQELLPLNDKEIAIPKEGGTVKIEGVEVIQNEEGIPYFKQSQ